MIMKEREREEREIRRRGQGSRRGSIREQHSIMISVTIEPAIAKKDVPID